MYPVDLLRSLSMANVGSGKSTLQLVQEFHGNFGLKGFFTQGLVPEVTRATWMRGLKFSLFPILHSAAFGRSDKEGTPGTLAIAAVLTSIPEVLTIMPLECAKIMLTLDTTKRFSNSMLLALAQVYKSQGLGGFLTGWTGIQYRQAAWGAGYFASLPTFKRKTIAALNKLQPEGSNKDVTDTKAGKMAVDLTSGFLAGVFGACFNTPGDTIRSVVQKRIFAAAQTGIPSKLPTTFLTVGKQIAQEKGVTALWAGFGFKALHLGGGGALMALLIPYFKGIM
jgi:hypothetical protein